MSCAFGFKVFNKFCNLLLAFNVLARNLSWLNLMNSSWTHKNSDNMCNAHKKGKTR
jgi:hypothetical protein